MQARRIAALVAIAALVPSLSFALNDTPAPTPAGTSTPAASPSPINAGFRRSDANPAVPGAKTFKDAQTFEGGLQVGTTAAGATSVAFLKHVACGVDPVAMTLPGQSTVFRCAATGALAGDYASCQLPMGSASGAVIKSVGTGTDYIDVALAAISDSFADVGAVTLQCLVIR